MIPTTIPAGYMAYRYLKLEPEKHNPELILRDRKLQATAIAWITVVGLVSYFGGT